MARRILLVDDDDAYRYATKKSLSEAGFEIADAHDYRGALDVLEDKKPLDLLVIDVVIPGVNGFALARMARMRHLGLKVIYISAFDIPTDEAVGPVLRKPVDDETLLKTVQDTLAAPPS